MDELSLSFLFSFISVLILMSAYFSGSETAMMALNRYRLRHLASREKSSSGARKAARLLQRPDRLLAVILIGNNFVNFLAASLATVIAVRLVGDAGLALAPVLCTLIFLLFAEVAPKTISAAYPERIALPSSHLLMLLLWVTYPLVWSVNLVTNGLLRLFGVSQPDAADNLSVEELRTVVYEGSHLGHPQGMLLGILDLDRVTVDDIMVPRSEIVGLDLEDDFDSILVQLRTSRHTRLPVFDREIEALLGVLHMRNASHFLMGEEKDAEGLREEVTKPVFVPTGTPLQSQLFNFKKLKERMGFVVNEYGEILGLITLDDILEEIVGEFTTDLDTISSDINLQSDGSCLIDGSAHIRNINRHLDWDLPEDGPKTLNGLITEFLEAIPEAPMCLCIHDYRIEIVQISDKMIRTTRILPPEEPAEAQNEAEEEAADA